jgi:hypothetical protein
VTLAGLLLFIIGVSIGLLGHVAEGKLGVRRPDLSMWERQSRPTRMWNRERKRSPGPGSAAFCDRAGAPTETKIGFRALRDRFV